MKYSRVLLLAPIAALLATAQVPADEFGQQLARQLARFYQTTTPEKAYLHFDKDTYVAGETIWYNAYVVDAARHRPDSLSQVLYVDLLNAEQQVLAHQTLALHHGTAPGDFALPAALPQGVYTVRAYTNWMRNTPAYFFRRPLRIWSETVAPPSRKTAAARPDVQFFPEGGQLVQGLRSVVAFKAIDGNGLGLAVQGTVQDEQGQVVAQLGAQHLGMGRFELQPAAGHQYAAHIQGPAGSALTYPLPAALATGLALQVQDLGDAYQLTVRRQAAAGAAPEPVTVAAHVRGQLAGLEQGTVRDETPLVVRLPKNRFAAGIAHFTVFDGQRTARCERLAFADTNPGLRLTLQPDKATYRPREKATVRILAQDAAGRPVAGAFSLAVTDAALVPAAPGTPDIRTHLLLTSDLQGQVEQPGYYFNGPTAATARALDDLLLTQGWRRFVWPPLLAGQPGALPYALEPGLSMRGLVVGSHQEPVAGVPVTLTRFKPGSTQQTTTDAGGRFVFGGFSGLDSAVVKLEAAPIRKVRRPQLLLDTDAPAAPGEALALSDAPAVEAVRAARLAQVKAQGGPAPGRGVLLGNVTVQGQAPALKPDNRRIYTRADVIIQTRAIPGINTYKDVVQVLQGRVPGMQVVANQGFVQITMRGSATNSTQQMRLSQAPASSSTPRMRGAAFESSTPNQNTPLFLLDGVPTDINMINSIPAVDFESIEVLRANSAAIYGERAGGGAIAFFTKQANPNYNPAEDKAVVAPPFYAVPRYYPAREFYVPAYGRSAASAAPDTRATTLYWNPQVRTDADGQATVSFYCGGEAAASCRLVLEGLAHTGTPGRGEAALRVAAAR